MIGTATSLQQTDTPASGGAEAMIPEGRVPILPQAELAELPRSDTDSSSRPECPECHGSHWIKTFTPWGCPTSTACPRCSGTSAGPQLVT